MSGPLGSKPGWSRWWTYQRERFPIVGHGLLVLAFSSAAVCHSALLRGAQPDAAALASSGPRLASFVVAFLVCFLFFLQLRIADEWKDAEEDARVRPDRPVPRGLVTLRELAVLGVIAAVIQIAASVALAPALIAILAVGWGYFALMSREFFVADWLRPRHALYLLSHMLVMPIVDCFATACDWILHQPADRLVAPPAALGWFLAASYCNGVVIEIGRKLRPPPDEQPGVATYTAVWGRRTAVLAWSAAILGATGLGCMAARAIGMPLLGATTLVAAAAVALLVAVQFARNPAPGSGKRMELVSGLWTIAFAIAVGLLPMLLKGLASTGDASR
jgi:4-hydroxybenzoate polyprenyltransferase